MEALVCSNLATVRRNQNARKRNRAGVICAALSVLLGVGRAANLGHATDQPRHSESTNNCNDRSLSYSFYDNGAKSWKADDYHADAIADVALENLEHPKAQDGSQLVTLQRHPNGAPGVDVILTREWLPIGEEWQDNQIVHGNSSCSWWTGYAHIKINSLYATSGKFLWQVVTHEMLHLLGANHGGRYDSFYPAAENDPRGTRTTTCRDRSTFPTIAQHFTDDVAYLAWLHDPAPYRQLMADSGFENGYADVWWKIGSGDWYSFNWSGAASGDRAALYKPPVYSADNSIQGRVRLQTGTGNEQYRARLRARSVDGYSRPVRVKLFHRYQNYDGNNGCKYADGLENTDPNDLPSPGAWITRQDVAQNVGGSWTTVGSSGWWNPPSNSDAQDFSIWVEASAYGVYLDNVTIEGTG